MSCASDAIPVNVTAGQSQVQQGGGHCNNLPSILRICTEKLNPFFVCTSLTMTLIYPVFWALKSSSCSTSANLLSWLHLHHSQTRSACMSESSYDENKNIIMHSVGLSPFFLGEMSIMLLVCNHEVAYLSII